VEGVVLRDLGDKFCLVFEDLGPGFDPFDVLLDALARAEFEWDLHDCISQQEDSLSHMRGVTNLEVLDRLANVFPNSDPVMLTFLNMGQLIVPNKSEQEASHKRQNI